MPRGKRNVYAGTCSTVGCNRRNATVRLHNQRGDKSWRDFKIEKYCPTCRKRTPVKFKQERHSK